MTPIDARVAMALVKNYGVNHWGVINASATLTALRNPGSIYDSRSAWFSITELQGFINNVNTLAAANCGTLTGPFGFRIYYGEYPAPGSPMWGTTIPTMYEQYAGMLTLLFVPTYYDGTNNVDFDPAFGTGGVPMAWAAIIAAPPPVMLTEMEHASLCPPPYPNIYSVGDTFMLLADTH